MVKEVLEANDGVSVTDANLTATYCKAPDASATGGTADTAMKDCSGVY